MRIPDQPPDPAAPLPASGCGGRFELALVAAFKAGNGVSPPSRIVRPPRG